ncbi:AbrB/MazE/SpoVT family DNA-binding domain-containing protein [Bacillus pumilus]|nr:AbrB/MazE/SpoVT family DNA-binding domain-containing protein [Bacillus pumilus]OLP65249.1 putative transition state regulator Abh [Bacillus pumilus]
MKRTGMVRQIDSLGRIVLPSEMRRVLNIKEEQLLEIFIDNQTIMLKKYEADKSCLLTGQVTKYNKGYGNGKVMLSPEGAERLLVELKQLLKEEASH